ncbi:hypothetical protein HZH68_012233 [Vespula germanica]|uniref:Uncharacterized protein n=1 Tax=Vespula germanica TaxID=30212 RepID=A0A834JMV9_VESGE|nr:hypothetical protein HZH68_012233 [Vespula germanica]
MVYDQRMEFRNQALARVFGVLSGPNLSVLNKTGFRRRLEQCDTQLCSAKGLRDSRERQQLTSPETFSEQHSHTLTESCTTKKESASNCEET